MLFWHWSLLFTFCMSSRFHVMFLISFFCRLMLTYFFTGWDLALDFRCLGLSFRCLALTLTLGFGSFLFRRGFSWGSFSRMNCCSGRCCWLWGLGLFMALRCLWFVMLHFLRCLVGLWTMGLVRFLNVHILILVSKIFMLLGLFFTLRGMRSLLFRFVDLLLMRSSRFRLMMLMMLLGLVLHSHLQWFLIIFTIY